MISLASPSKKTSCMNEGDIVVSLTESQHEIINDILMNALEGFQLVAPYDAGLFDLPLDNELIQRYTIIQNLKEMFFELWSDRFIAED
jgi:hypothetical protein